LTKGIRDAVINGPFKPTRIVNNVVVSNQFFALTLDEYYRVT